MSLELLALHWIGDYLLQTDYMAAHKLSSARVRMLHVATYSIPFAVWLMIAGRPWVTVAAVTAFVAVTHYIIDGRRVTLGSRWAHKPMVLDQGFHLIILVVIQHVLGGY